MGAQAGIQKQIRSPARLSWAGRTYRSHEVVERIREGRKGMGGIGFDSQSTLKNHRLARTAGL